MDLSPSIKTRVNREAPMLTPPTTVVNLFSRLATLDTKIASDLEEKASRSTSTIGITPPSTASPMKRFRHSVSPERHVIGHDGITSFDNADPPCANLLGAPPSSESQSHQPQQDQRPLSHPTPRNPPRSPSPGYQNNTIVKTIRELGTLKYLQMVNDPRFLPARLRPTAASPEPATRPARRPAAKKNNKKVVATGRAPEQKRKLSNLDAPTTRALTPREGNGQNTRGRTKSSVPEIKLKLSLPSAQTAMSTPGRKRRFSEVSCSPVHPLTSSKAQNSRHVPSSIEHKSPAKKSKLTSQTVASPKSSPAKPRNRKPSKKVASIGTSKPEKSRTKEQRWGDHLKSVVGGEKDVYQKLPDLAIPPLGHLIDHAPVRPYTFNKGKVQDYGSGAGLHLREMELAQEVGLSYDAYRQQKRMAFVGYAAMQLEGKKEFKKSHTQSMCNIDGNKATHLWTHFHDVWGWMPENPLHPITRASLGGLQLPELRVA